MLEGGEGRGGQRREFGSMRSSLGTEGSDVMNCKRRCTYVNVVEALLLDHLDALGEEGVAGRGGQGAGGLGGTRVEVAHVALTRAWWLEKLKEKKCEKSGAERERKQRGGPCIFGLEGAGKYMGKEGGCLTVHGGGDLREERHVEVVLLDDELGPVVARQPRGAAVVEGLADVLEQLRHWSKPWDGRELSKVMLQAPGGGQMGRSEGVF